MIRSINGSNSFDNSLPSHFVPATENRALSAGRILRYDSADSFSAQAGKPASASKDVDMDVTGAGQVGGSGPVRPVNLARTPALDASAPSGVQVPSDEVVISNAAQALSGSRMDPEVRAARLAAIKSEIEAGTYDTPQRMEAAIEKMISGWRSNG